MDIQESVLKITDYDEILNLRGEPLLFVTNHEEIFSLNETQKTKRAQKVRKRRNYEEDDFFDYIKEVENQKFDFKRFFSYKQKRIRTKRAKANLHGKGGSPLINSAKETTRREKLPYCQSEIFPCPNDSSSFFKRWHNFSLPRFTIYRMSRHSVGSMRFDKIASTLSLVANDRHMASSEFDLENIWRLNNLLNKDGDHPQYILKSHLRQHKEDHDILELFRIYCAGFKKAPQVYYDSNAEIKPSLKYIASLEVLDREKALVETARKTSIKPSMTLLEEKERIRNRVQFEQKKSILPDFMYTGEEQFRVIVYDDEVPHLNFEVDIDNRKKRVRKSVSEESVLKLKPDLRNVKLISDSELLSDTSLIGMGDYGITAEDIRKPVMLKFKNMPELLGWFRKINEKELELLSSETDNAIETKVLKKVDSLQKKDLRKVVAKTPMVGLKKFQPRDPNSGFETKKLEVTTHDTILSILPRSAKKDDTTSESDVKEECTSIDTVIDRLTSSCVNKKKPTSKNISYKTRSLKKDSLQRIKSSIVNEVVKKVASYFSKDLKPKLEASIKEGQCSCCKHKPTAASKATTMPQERKAQTRVCLCHQKKGPIISRGVNVDLDGLSSDSSKYSPEPNFHIYTCPTVTYSRNTGVNANTIQDYGSFGDALPAMSFDCQKMLEIYENLAKTAEEQMIKLREYHKLIQKPVKDVRICDARKISSIETINDLCKLITNNELSAKDNYIPADFSSHVLDRILEDPPEREESKDAIDLNLSKQPPKLVDYMLESCSSSESIQSRGSSHKDILNVKPVVAVPKQNISVCKITSNKKYTLDDTYNITDITDFECYINYICTHSEKFRQVSADLLAKKLKRQTSDNNLVNFNKRGLNFDLKFFGKVDLNNEIDNSTNELLTIFKRGSKKGDE